MNAMSSGGFGSGVGAGFGAGLGAGSGAGSSAANPLAPGLGVGPRDAVAATRDPRGASPDFLLRLLAALSEPEESSTLEVGGSEEGFAPGEGSHPAGSRLLDRFVEPERSVALLRPDTPTDRVASPDPSFGEADTSVEASASVEGDPSVEATTSPRPPLGRMEGVHPELVARVERVADRMWNEFGHRVEVVEGHRTQARQDRLYAQGRSTPGPQVTWTRNSAHTRGEAVDVRIDGGWDNTRAFERLQQVAREEGIRTLGMRDAGHLELPRGAASGGAAPAAGWQPVSPGGVAPGASAPQGAQPQGAAPAASVEPVLRSGVAQVAQVAQVARVARPGHGLGLGRLQGQGQSQRVERMASAGESRGGGGAAPSATLDPESAARLAAVQARMAQMGGLDPLGGRTLEMLRGEAGEAEGEGVRLAGTSTPFIELASAGGETRGPSMAELTSQLLNGAVREGGGLPQLMGVGGAAGLAPGAGTLLRAEQIRAIQAAAGPMSNLAVELLNVDGAGTDLHLGMRGRDVTARIDAVDPLQARALRLRLGELRSTLSERGLEAERLGVRLLQSEPLLPVREGERGGEASSRQGGDSGAGDRGDPRGHDRGDHLGEEGRRGQGQDDASGRGGTHPSDGGFRELYEGRQHDQ